MKLLTWSRINELMDHGAIRITNFSVDQLTPINYLFRLGKFKLPAPATLASGHAHSDELTLPPNGYATITTLERFTLARNIMGLITQVSDLPQLGLRLNHSMVIDPEFNGALEMALQNCLGQQCHFPKTQNLGKIYFFEVPEMYNEDNFQDTKLRDKWKRRASIDEPDIPGMLQWF